MNRRGWKATGMVLVSTLIASAVSGGSVPVIYATMFLLFIPATVYMHWDELKRGRG